jgi:hypothetical protein
MLSHIKAFIIALLFSYNFILPGAYAVEKFQTNQPAQKRRLSDIVVLLNIPTHIWRFKEESWYGRTLNGDYAFMKEAEKEGNRGTRNGQ